MKANELKKIQNIKKSIGYAAIAIIVLNFFYFFYRQVFSEPLSFIYFWIIIAIVSIIAFPILKYLRRIEEKLNK